MTAKKDAEKAERILNAAIVRFAQNGYTQTTISQIAKASGVSFGTVFTYYENKEALFRAAVLDRLHSWEPLFLDISCGENESPIEAIKEMIGNHVRLLAQEEQYLRLVQYVIGQPDRFREIFDELDGFLSRFVDALQPVVENGQQYGQLVQIDSEAVALSYLSFINGIRLTITGELKSSFWEICAEQALRLFGPREGIG